jgi:hypothetical protein
VNSILGTSTFWQPYLTLEPGEVSEEGFAVQLEELRRDFAVRDEISQYEYSGRQHRAVRRVVEFPFTCGERFSLVLDYQPAVTGCRTTLFLADTHSGTKREMGWWDLARWHPYCLRPLELDSLLQFWKLWDPRWRGQETPLLLLCQFVGLPDLGARDALTARAQTVLQSLGLPGANESQLEVPLYVPDGNYRWEEDAELGWVFTSDEYCCYSIRNRPHFDSDEGRFPFTAFREMMNEVQQRLGEG